MPSKSKRQHLPPLQTLSISHAPPQTARAPAKSSAQSSNVSSGPHEIGSPKTLDSPSIPDSVGSRTKLSEAAEFFQSERAFRPPPPCPYDDANRPLGSPRTWLVTPSSSLCSTPPAWKDTIPQEPLKLTFGIELEHLFTFDRFPDPSWEWMLPQEGDEIEVFIEAPGLTDDAASDAKKFKGKPWRSPTEYDTSSVAQWDLKGDCSIAGPEDMPNWLRTHLPGKRISKDEEADWISPTKGHELVSRILEAPSDLSSFDTFKRHPDLQEIANYLRAMHGAPADPYGVFVNATCGFHLHVARATQSDSRKVMLPLPVLQHLSYMLVQYEELITSLHAPERRALALEHEMDREYYIGSNLMGFRRSSHLCRAHAQVENEIAQRKIFASNMTSERLGNLMGTDVFSGYSTVDVQDEIALRPAKCVTNERTRYKFVNFDRLLQKKLDAGAKTIEFRQHRGTLDFTEIAHWIHFVLSLVKAAERKASSTEPASPAVPHNSTDKMHRKLKFPIKQGDKYNRRTGKLKDQFVKFFDLLEFDEETRGYWMRKFHEYNPVKSLVVEKDKMGAERIVTKEGLCPACQEEEEMYEDIFEYMRKLQLTNPVPPNSNPNSRW